MERAEGEVGEGNESESEGGGEEAHGNVGDVVGTVLAADVLEVEGAALESEEPGDEGDEKFGEGRVDVHEEARLDVPAGSEGVRRSTQEAMQA